jgi:methionyl aminopeptidase
MTIETPEQITKLRKIGAIVAQTIRLMGNSIQPGMTTRELDDIGRVYLAVNGAKSAPEVVYQFPGATCISVNHEVAHGVPGDRVIQQGDLVNIDVSAELDGYFADSGYTFTVCAPNPTQEKILSVTQLALERAIAAVKADVPLNVIGQAIESVARENECSMILNLGSHGVGRGLHEEPFFIPPYYDETDTRMLREGMVITIEPFISNGAWEVQQASDGWTLYTDPQFVTAQFEHTMIVTKTGATLLTAA